MPVGSVPPGHGSACRCSRTGSRRTGRRVSPGGSGTAPETDTARASHGQRPADLPGEPACGRRTSRMTTFASVSARQNSLCRAECNKAPSMYEMEGALLWPRRAEAASCPASPALRAARQGQAPMRYTGFPVHPHVSGVALRWCPFPTVKAFLRPLRLVAQEPAAVHFKFLPHPHDVHRTRPLIRISRQLSTALYTRNPQVARYSPASTVMRSGFGLR